MDRPITTLFMLVSVDGKISTGATDVLDVDQDYACMDGVKEGLHQYYEIEQTTDLWSLNTGRVQTKLGVNEKEMPPKTPVSFVLIGNSHLNEHGVRFFCELSNQFVLITTNPDYPSGRTVPGEGTGEAEGGIRVRQNYDPKRRDRERTVPAGEAL